MGVFKLKNLKRNFIYILVISILFSSLTLNVGSINLSNFLKEKNFETNNDDDFYFVQITDTHVINAQSYKEKFLRIISHVSEFKEKPAFIVITGDLVEWGGRGLSGALNYQALTSCLYQDEGQFYADSDLAIPIYFTPGNHDYCFDRSLENYHNYISNEYVDTNDNYIIEYKNLTMFFMNSGPNYYDDPMDWADVMGDGLYESDIIWFEDNLINYSSKHKIVLMHHPVVNDRNKDNEMHNVIARNRVEFIDLCEIYDVDIVLTGHTHRSVIFDKDENKFYKEPINCSKYPPLYIQTDDCKQDSNYRNISIIDNDIWIEETQEIDININPVNRNLFRFSFNILELLEILKSRIY